MYCVGMLHKINDLFIFYNYEFYKILKKLIIITVFDYNIYYIVYNQWFYIYIYTTLYQLKISVYVKVLTD